ncbi:hypothetical protein OG562_31045 [Streptomyces sp. NBC_01275]|uniref:hypothetical protein n=1 Tax=Streptomyces sp. NBC_01275 TaxID=2903807 RepID=UPI002259A34D|nr:hypothetical protein [Streptomyces sp. NBC_01275]MCX4765337.1 hypothetical protein [Streptomyces sp. NBC_01275]
MDYPALERAARREDSAELVRHAASELHQVVTGRRALHAVRHPLGFVCLPVLRDGPRGVCVHVFGPTDPILTDHQIHSHSWELISTVLYGRLGNRRMGVDEDTEKPTHRVFEVHSDPTGLDELRPTRRLVRCLPGAEQTSSRGQTYALPAGEFHTTVVPDGRPTATLVLGRTLPGRADLSLGPVRAPGHRVMRRQCDTAQTARIARAALWRIHEPEPPREPPV